MFSTLDLVSPWTALGLLISFLLYRSLVAWSQSFETIGVDHVKPWPIFGNLAAAFLRRTSFVDVLTEHYSKFRHRSFYGFFDFYVPLLMVRDPELIKQITVRDFDHFVDHRTYLPRPDDEPLLGNSLFLMCGETWREMRATLSPAFTGSKVRFMFDVVVGCSRKYAQMLLTDCKHLQGRPLTVEMKDVTMRYAVDVIAATAFDIHVDSWRDRDNFIYTMATESMQFHNGLNLAKFAFISFFPQLSKWLRIRLFTKAQSRFYQSLVHDTMEHRETNSIRRPDMIQLLMESRQADAKQRNDLQTDAEGFGGASAVSEEGSEDMRGGGFRKRLWSEIDVTAQCYLFQFVGSETLSALLCFAAQELMENRHVQNKLYAELRETERVLNGSPVTYDMLYRLPYLDMVVSETLRKWPPTVFMDRQCTKDYQMTDKNTGHTITVKKGTCICMPIFPLQRDPAYYPNPDVFDPERFSDERKHSIPPFTFLALGVGPRSCIGSRFVLIKVKAFLYSLLSAFSLEPGASTEIPIQLTGGGWLLKAKNGFNIQLRPRPASSP